MRYRAPASGPQASGPRPGKVYRGSRKRVRRIRMRGNWAVELWILVAVILFVLFVVVPWLVQPPPLDHQHVETVKQ